MEELGPVQILVVGFAGNRFNGEILPELRRLRDRDIIRLVDLLFVTIDEDGSVTALDIADLSEVDVKNRGAIAGALVGFDAEEDSEADDAQAAAQWGNLQDEETWAVADAIPPGTSAAVALIEHRWAIPLRDAIERAGGFAIEDTWVHPKDLAAAGAVAADGRTNQ
jgi:hypothetical protein